LDADTIIKEKKKILIVGGSIFYIEVLLNGLSQIPTGANLRNSLSNEYDSNPERIYSELRQKDPDAAQKIHLNDKYRIVRAMSVIRSTGKRYSSFKNKQSSKYKAKCLFLTLPREELYKKINLRVEKMFSSGFVDEVKKASCSWLYKRPQSFEHSWL